MVLALRAETRRFTTESSTVFEALLAFLASVYSKYFAPPLHFAISYHDGEDDCSVSSGTTWSCERVLIGAGCCVGVDTTNAATDVEAAAAPLLLGDGGTIGQMMKGGVDKPDVDGEGENTGCASGVSSNEQRSLKTAPAPAADAACKRISCIVCADASSVRPA